MEVIAFITMVSVIGMYSCVGVIYRNSKKSSKQLDEIIMLLRELTRKP